MSLPHLAVTLILVIFQFTLPKRWAFVPLLIAALHTSMAQIVPSFSTARLLIVAGLVRAVATGELRFSARNPLDVLITAFGFITIASSVGHEGLYSNPFIIRVRMALDVCGTFFYARAFLTDINAYKRLAQATSFILVPLAVAMAYTKLTAGSNFYSMLGGSSSLLVRNGTIRATGPFGTPILAGTIGAILFPTIIIIWKTHRKTVILGIAGCLAVIFSAGSSTPIGAMLISLVALVFWKWRAHLKTIVIVAIFMMLFLHFAREKPIWYMIAITDFVGGSTGWHRAYLIDMAIEHFSEWWLWGAEYTRHWMPYGLPNVPQHCDLTNYYINLGVFAGFPLTIVLVLIFWKSIKCIAFAMKKIPEEDTKGSFLIWSLGALIFTHAITSMTISYFDQTYIIFYFLIAVIANVFENSRTMQTSPGDASSSEQPRQPQNALPNI